jgi:hypothetical protein
LLPLCKLLEFKRTLLQVSTSLWLRHASREETRIVTIIFYFVSSLLQLPSIKQSQSEAK